MPRHRPSPSWRLSASRTWPASVSTVFRGWLTYTSSLCSGWRILPRQIPSAQETMMPTGQAAQQAASQQPKTEPHKDDDRGPGSLAGNLTADPDLRYTGNGRPVSNLRVACAERIRDDKTGQWKDGPTAFYDVICWGNLAENVAEHLRRGDRIVVEGRWTSRRWEDNDGNAQERIVLTARDLGPSMMFRGAIPQRKNGGR